MGPDPEYPQVYPYMQTWEQIHGSGGGLKKERIGEWEEVYKGTRT